MTLYLLDADCIIDHLRMRPPARAMVHRLDAQGDELCTSDVVLTEVYSGLYEPDRPAMERLLVGLRYLPTNARAAIQAGVWRYQYRRIGRQLATTDCLIAATAYIHGAVLVTGNLRDFPMPEIAVLPLDE